jgi:hypothetical protein
VVAETISVDTTDLGTTPEGDRIGRYHFVLDGFSLLENQEIEIRFNPAVFVALSNGIAPADLDPLILQPNNPPTLPGIYSLLSLVNNPSLAEPLSIDVVVKGPNFPVNLPFAKNRFAFVDGNLQFQETLLSGTTLGTPSDVIPEPGTLFLVGGVVLLIGVVRGKWRRPMHK